MSSTKRVQQLAAFARNWYLFDARCQNPFHAGPKLAAILSGKTKPIYHKESDCGDHVVVINARHIALPGNEWEKRAYYHHSGYAKGKTWTMAHQVHQSHPTYIFQRAVYKFLCRSLNRPRDMCRLHLFPDDKVPEEIMGNINNQVRRLREVPKRLDQYTQEEIDNFPKVFDWPKQYVIDPDIVRKNSVTKQM